MITRIGLGVFMVVALAINLSILAGLVYEIVWTVRELGWWWTLLINAGIFVFVGVVFWELGGERFLDWLFDRWDSWHYARGGGELTDASLVPQAPNLPSSMPERGSFAALVDTERRIRSTQD